MSSTTTPTTSWHFSSDEPTCFPAAASFEMTNEIGWCFSERRAGRCRFFLVLIDCGEKNIKRQLKM
jgi:hypothetical protein